MMPIYSVEIGLDHHMWRLNKYKYNDEYIMFENAIKINPLDELTRRSLADWFLDRGEDVLASFVMASVEKMAQQRILKRILKSYHQPKLKVRFVGGPADGKTRMVPVPLLPVFYTEDLTVNNVLDFSIGGSPKSYPLLAYKLTTIGGVKVYEYIPTNSSPTPLPETPSHPTVRE